MTSLQWSINDPNVIAVGTSINEIQLWDIGGSSFKKVRTLRGHNARVSSLSWNSNMLTSGGRDSVILNHDTRISNHLQQCLVGHQQEVCGLAWSPDGKILKELKKETGVITTVVDPNLSKKLRKIIPSLKSE